MFYKSMIFFSIVFLIPLTGFTELNVDPGATTGVICTEGSGDPSPKTEISGTDVKIDCEKIKPEVVGACRCVNNQLLDLTNPYCQEQMAKPGGIYLP